MPPCSPRLSFEPLKGLEVGYPVKVGIRVAPAIILLQPVRRIVTVQKDSRLQSDAPDVVKFCRRVREHRWPHRQPISSYAKELPTYFKFGEACCCFIS